MGAAAVKMKELDLSTRVPSFPGVYGGIVIPAKKGPVNDPQLMTSDTELLQVFSPDERLEVGYDLAYFSALAFLERSNKLWVVRAAKQSKYAAAAVKRIDAATANQTKPVSPGIADPTAYLFDTEDDVVAAAEVTEFTALADVAGSLGGKYFDWYEFPVSRYYAWFQVAVAAIKEVTNIVTVADVASSLNNKYFLINSTTVDYYVWYNVGGAGTDPALVGKTGIAVNVTANSTAAAVATATSAAIAALGAVFSTALASNTVTVTHQVAGVVVDAADVDTTFTVTVGTQGAAATTIGSDPAVPSATGVMVSIAQNATAAQVASAVIVALSAHGAAAVSGQPTKLRITNAAAGDVPHSTAGSSGFTVVLITDGATTVNNIDEALLIYAANQGAWGSNVGFKLITYTANPDKVKEPGSFLIEVYKMSNLATPLETWLCSRIPGKRDGYGKNIYVNDVLEGSNYIRSIDNVAVASNIFPKDQVSVLALGGGDDGVAVTDAECMTAAGKLASKADLALTVMLDGGRATVAYQTYLDSMVTLRADSVALLSVPFSAEASSTYLNDIIDYRKTQLNLNSSYSALYTPHVLVYDKFNDRRIYVAPDGYAGAAISYSASNFEIWFPPAGFKRGLVKVLDVRRKFDAGQRDALYDAGINPFRFTPGKGIAIWGQKTLLARPSALDRLNVRLLLIVIEPAVEQALEDFLFDLNDESTRAIVKTIIDEYLSGIQSKRGLQDYRTVCDATNNTASDIDNNRLNVDLYVKPTRSIEEIPVRVVITATSISFEVAQRLV
jgi:phage tail sheath protein FI